MSVAVPVRRLLYPHRLVDAASVWSSLAHVRCSQPHCCFSHTFHFPFTLSIIYWCYLFLKIFSKFERMTSPLIFDNLAWINACKIFVHSVCVCVCACISHCVYYSGLIWYGCIYLKFIPLAPNIFLVWCYCYWFAIHCVCVPESCRFEYKKKTHKRTIKSACK